MVRPPCFDRNGMKKGAWSEEEDSKLRAHINEYGHRNWRLVPIFAGKPMVFSSYQAFLLELMKRFLNYIYQMWEELQTALGELSQARSKTGKLH